MFSVHSAFPIAASILALLVFSCNEGPSEVSQASGHYEEPPTLSRMALLQSGGQTLKLGSDDEMANALEEKPRMPVTFHYHFAIDSFEVTQGLWKRIMQQESDASSKTGRGSLLPVYNVTWYDAVLFCNARSRAHGLDTVYSYTGITRDSKGHVRDLIGWVAHFDRLGFRLPTEAEWQWAASEGGVTDRPWRGATPEAQAWYIANSKGQVHAVGSKGENQFGLHDMLGNVMEWTHDWKIGLRSDTIADFIGGLYPSTLEEKVVKGGSFMSALPQLRPGSRGATYPVTAASALEYVGFRCVLGKIAEPRYLTEDSQDLPSFEALQSLMPAIQQRFGHQRMRIALVRTRSQADRSLQVVEIVQDRFTVKEWRYDQPVFAPVLSPDGQWIAFSTTGEGMTRQGVVKVVASNLKDSASVWTWQGATLPRWHVDPVSRDTFLVAASSGVDNTEAGFASGATYRVRMKSGRPDGSVTTLGSGAYHDGLSPQGDFLASGYRHLRVKELATGQESVLFTAPVNGKRNEDTAQACNVSWRPRDDDSAQMLFLDFGAAEASALVGRPYGIHEIAFLIDARGSIVRHFAAPSGYAAFADLEWSNSPRYAVTVLEDSDRRPTTLAVLDAETGITTPILSGSGLLQPSLWFGAPDDSRPTTSAALRDSLFRYEEPFVHAIQGGFARKVRTFFTHAENVEIALVGSSHFEYGLASERIFGGKAVNLSISSTWHYTAETLLKNYVVPHAPKLKAVVFNVVPGLFAANLGEPTLQEAILSSRGFRFDESHQFWRNGLPGELKAMAASLPQPGWLPTDSMGNYSAPSNGWGPDSIPLASWVVPNLEPVHLQTHQKVFIRIIQFLNSHGIAVLFVETPKHPGYGAKGNGYVSHIGPSVSDAEKIHALIQGACSEHPRCALYDAHRLGKHDYVSEDFFDHDHLSRRGAEKLSTRIDSALADVLSP